MLLNTVRAHGSQNMRDKVEQQNEITWTDIILAINT